MVNNCIKYIQSFLFPDYCLLCGDKGTEGLDLCTACLQELPHNRHCCQRCALPLPKSVGANRLCGNCLQSPPIFQRSIIPFIYHPPVDQLIIGLKDGQQLINARLLAQLLAREILLSKEPLPQIIMPIPMHRRHLRERGFNQTSELARHLSVELGIPWSTDHLLKNRHTVPQRSLDKKARKRNLKGSFGYSTKKPFRHVAILDDVMTTGSTVNEAARTLQRAGVEEISIWAVARTPVFGTG